MFSFPNPFDKPQKADCTSATGYPSSTLTPDILADCMKLLANPPPMPRAHFVNPQVMEALKKESVPAPHPISSILGMPFFVMENQKADCWIISDPHLAKAYREGHISEDALKRMNDRIVEIRTSQENAGVLAHADENPS